ncbi:sulfite exporter TauE/SafE family protein [Desertibacillus haloalkaliphilus]|uniref:sulfite exporter TauE/SafE family protein n=1 Tax=Desertibacillus haloalkaliphilus TaxID=1328930 RepID=UPI001C266B33|nr:sulfite exporter TauE/SafE family protein [Desertibacillus haloalkaliphilus]MBU8906524.1 sulfite exporter TauE/SafE family protein [Desertibacillus haloalkaliphilus]
MGIEWLIVFLILFVGSFVQGVSGFGFGLLAMGFLPLLFTVKESTLLVVSLALVLSVSIALQLFKHIVWRSLVVILSAALVGRIGAFFILDQYGDQDILKVFLGIFLICVVIYLFRSKPPNPDRKVNNTWLPIILGLGGGLIGGIYAVGGPFFVFYYLLLFHDNKYAYSANLQISFLFTNFITATLHGVNGDFSLEFLGYFAIGLVSVIVGSRLGVHFFAKIPQQNIKKISAIVVAIAAINLVVSSLL